MREQSANLPKTFHMGLAEPLILIVIPIFGIYLSVSLLLTNPMEVDLYIPILVLVFCIYAIFAGLVMPRKLVIYDKEIIVYYLVWKRTMNVSNIKSYTLEQGPQGRGGGTRYFVTIHLNKGKKIRFKDIKKGNESLLRALEKWTGLKPLVDVESKIDDEEPGNLSGNDREFRPPEPLSELTEQLVQKIFPPDEQMEARQLLVNKCGNNIYAHEKRNKYELEALRFSALKLSKGNLKKLYYHVEKGNEDFRNLYYGSGFSGEKGDDELKKWVESVLNKK